MVAMLVILSGALLVFSAAYAVEGVDAENGRVFIKHSWAFYEKFFAKVTLIFIVILAVLGRGYLYHVSFSYDVAADGWVRGVASYASITFAIAALFYAVARDLALYSQKRYHQRLQKSLIEQYQRDLKDAVAGELFHNAIAPMLRQGKTSLEITLDDLEEIDLKKDLAY